MQKCHRVGKNRTSPRRTARKRKKCNTLVKNNSRRRKPHGTQKCDSVIKNRTLTKRKTKTHQKCDTVVKNDARTETAEARNKEKVRYCYQKRHRDKEDKAHYHQKCDTVVKRYMKCADSLILLQMFTVTGTTQI